MRTFYVITEEKELVKALEGALKTTKAELELLGNDTFTEETKQNINLMQPDFIITDYTEKHIAEEMLNLSPQSMVILLSNDMNRSNDTVTQLQSKGYRQITTVDMSIVNPISLVEEMQTMELSQKEEEDDFNVFTEAFNESINEKDIEKVDVKVEERKTETQAQTPETNTEIKEDITKSLEEEKQEINNQMNVNLSNVRTKTISLFSKKGGTGKTFIAKEIANIYSSIKLPKRLANSKEFLTSCVVDLDFESGNLRTSLGISNPTPNIYVWISDILDKIEAKADINSIYFNRFQVMNYVQKIGKGGRNFVLVSGQGGVPIRTLQRMSVLDQDGELFSKIIKIIIKSIQRVFDVVVLDLESNVSDITFEAMKHSDNIIYVLNNTVSDLENFKVFTDEASKLELDLNKIAVVINKLEKGVHLNASMLDLLSLIKFKDVDFKTGKKVEKVFPLIADMPYNKEVINKMNNYEYITNSSSDVKKGILKLCEYCLPIFKVKYTTAGIKELNRLKKINEKKKSKENIQKEKMKQREMREKFKTEEVRKETTVDNANENTQENNFENLESYLNSDLKKETLESFKENLIKNGAKVSEFGLPIITKKPKTISNKVWKTYTKEVEKDYKMRKKAKKQ